MKLDDLEKKALADMLCQDGMPSERASVLVERMQGYDERVTVELHRIAAHVSPDDFTIRGRDGHLYSMDRIMARGHSLYTAATVMELLMHGTPADELRAMAMLCRRVL